ncbi:hypothetical protein L596_030362 [Steinernema carpocapsae]|uniref:Uncharacterized protein n=1 Tax=Steinernema carpocapsae TaxID=34508 RepID=A0A4U5LP61_STECR|nr:hypothetical protein L596_030362 [Steinernema carpocapsae]
MADSNVFNTFSFKRWADIKKKANIDDESLKRRLEQVNRLKDKLKHERRLLEDAAAAHGKPKVINEFDVEKLIDHLNLGHQITEDGPTLNHDKADPNTKKGKNGKDAKNGKPEENKPPRNPKVDALKNKRPSSQTSLRSSSRESIKSTRSLKNLDFKDAEIDKTDSTDDLATLDLNQLYQKKDDDFILKELLNYYAMNNHTACQSAHDSNQFSLLS